MLYISDHGESLGENGIYLHGLPYAFAPEAQKRVPLIAWFGADLAARRGLDTAASAACWTTPYSHDNLYHSTLGLLDVTTPTYGASSTRSRRAAKPARVRDGATGASRSPPQETM